MNTKMSHINRRNFFQSLKRKTFFLKPMILPGCALQTSVRRTVAKDKKIQAIQRRTRTVILLSSTTTQSRWIRLQAIPLINTTLHGLGHMIGSHTYYIEKIYVIHQPGGPYWEKLCPRSWIPPEAVGQGRYPRRRAQFFPIRTDLVLVNNIFIFF